MYERPRPTPNHHDVGLFHAQFGLDNTTNAEVGPRAFDPELMGFRVNFLLEEVDEFIQAIGAKLEVSDIVVGGSRVVRAEVPEDAQVDHAQAFDALLDLVYVAMGTAHFLGYPWQEGWDLVQRANMSKVRAQKDGSDSKRGSSFDVVKPAGWTPPDIEGLLKRAGWNDDKENDK